MVFVTLKKYMKWVLFVGALCMVLSAFYIGFRGSLPRVDGQDMAQYDEPVAKVNGQDITWRQFLNAIASEMQNYQWYYGPVRPEDEEALSAVALDKLITDRLLLQAVEEEKISVTREELDAEIQKLKDEFESEEEFNTWMNSVGVTMKILEEYYTDYVKVTKLIELKKGVVEVTEDDIRNYYEGVELNQIFISSGEDALVRAQEIHAQLISGEDFGELAYEYSDDYQSAFYGGSVGFVRRGDFTEAELMEAAFALEVGEISPVISSADGYYIFQISGKKLVGDEEYEENKDAIKEELIARRQNENVNQWFADYRAKANIEIYDSQMKAYNLASEGKYEEAIVEYEKAIAKRAQDAYLYVSLAKVYQRLEDNENVIKNLELAVDRATSDPNLRWMLAKAYLEAERQDEAVAELKKASELAYESSYDNMLLHYYLYMEYQQLGMEEEAEAEFVIFQEMQNVIFGLYEDEAEDNEVSDGNTGEDVEQDDE